MAKKKLKTSEVAAESGVDRKLVKALGHPIRTQALSILNERVASPSELSTEMGVPLSDLAYHVRVLRECDCVELVRTRQVRGTVEHFYRAVKRAFLPDALIRILPTDSQDGIASKILREIVEDAGSSIESGAFTSREDLHISWTPLMLDEPAWQGLSELLAETLERAFRLQVEASNRIAADPDQANVLTATVALLGFESSRSQEE